MYVNFIASRIQWLRYFYVFVTLPHFSRLSCLSPVSVCFGNSWELWFCSGELREDITLPTLRNPVSTVKIFPRGFPTNAFITHSLTLIWRVKQLIDFSLLFSIYSAIFANPLLFMPQCLFDDRFFKFLFSLCVVGLMASTEIKWLLDEVSYSFLYRWQGLVV